MLIKTLIWKNFYLYYVDKDGLITKNIEIMKFTIMCLEKMAFYILYEYMIMGDGVMD